MRLGIIGGTGSQALFPGGEHLPPVATPWGTTSGPIGESAVSGHTVLFLPRHGPAGDIAPHRVNYRANIWALRELGASHVLGINTVGGITARAPAGGLVIPDQLIDYTWGRAQTFAGEHGRVLCHVDFTQPFAAGLRALLAGAAARAGLPVTTTATYGVTQGPRLETAAEIDRLERDGCDVVGMTAMPEAGLAREIDLSYALCCLVVNRAAGRGAPGQGPHVEMAAHAGAGMQAAGRLIAALLSPG